MTDREALLALAASAPEPFRQVRLKREDYLRWDKWNRRRVAALLYVRGKA